MAISVKQALTKNHLDISSPGLYNKTNNARRAGLQAGKGAHVVILKNAMLFADGQFRPVDISVSNGRIAAAAGEIPSLPGAVSIDLSHFAVFPGFVDVHVHLREPGFSYKETIRTGALAAARGGYTQVCSMPNLDPVPDDLDSLQIQLDAIARDAVVAVRP